MRLACHLLRSWRNSSTLIIAAPSGKPTRRNYDLLLLKRSSKSSFFPSAAVFPGGAISKSDYSEEWRNVFADAGIDNLDNALPKPRNEAPMFKEKDSESTIPSDIAYRICAIRETFEEAGILIHKAKGNVDPECMNAWRSTVHNDASKFIECCRELKIIPDIFSLFQWSDWLTPTHMPEMHNRRRFDTAFYLCCLNEKPNVTTCNLEIKSSSWNSADSFLDQFTHKELWLAPPQVYELSRMCNFSTINELNEFAKSREELGTERWLPVRVTCKDGVIALLPGDAMYPQFPVLEECDSEPLELPQDMDSYLDFTKPVHRFHFVSLYKTKVYSNISQLHGHMRPLTIESILQLNNSDS